MDHLDLDWVECLLNEALAGARALTVWLLLKNNEWDQLVTLRCDPSDYCDFDQLKFRRDYQATEFFRKIEDAPTSFDREANAKKSFWEAEAQCARTNRRLLPYLRARSSHLHYGTAQWVNNFIERWRRRISEILGPLPEEITFKFSSGSTYDDRLFITPMDKMSARPTVTQDAWEVIRPFWEKTLWCQGLLAEQPHRSMPRFIRGDRFTSVPKTAVTDRGIAVGASLNVTAQLGVGRVIRKRLRQNGLDLLRLQAVHKELVRWASLTRHLATIDLSSASDTVSYNLVKLLLPGHWFDLLDCLRAPETRIDRKWVNLSKFSAMGNGYTFELETLLFFTLCQTVASDEKVNIDAVTVYGDDIIVPSSIAPKVIDALIFFGFTPNKKKTYIDGTAFRESCGEDCFNGIPVRGYNLGKIPSQPQDYIKIANGIRRMARYDLETCGDLNSYTRAWLRVCNLIPTHERNYGPVHLGDFVINTDETSWWRTRIRHGYHELRVTVPDFDASAYTTVDRKFWTRSSIIAAAVEGYLKGTGYTLVETKNGTLKYVPGLYKLSRKEPIGWSNEWLTLSHCETPDWLDRWVNGERRESILRDRHLNRSSVLTLLRLPQ